MKTSRVLIGLLLMLAFSAQGSMVLWNKLGSDQEVTHSEVGPNGVVVGAVDYRPAQDGNGFTPQNPGYFDQPMNYVEFGNLQLGQRGAIEFWYWANWSDPGTAGGVVNIMECGLPGYYNQFLTMEYNDGQDKFAVKASSHESYVYVLVEHIGSLPQWRMDRPMHFRVEWDGTDQTTQNHLRFYIDGVQLGAYVEDGPGRFDHWVPGSRFILGSRLTPGVSSYHYWRGDGGIFDDLKVYTSLPPVGDAGPNLQITRADQCRTVIQGTATDPDNDSLQYRWLEGSQVLLDWSAVGADGEASLALSSLLSFSIGGHTLTLQVKDAISMTSDDMMLTIQNSPPEAGPAPSSQTVKLGIDPVIVTAYVADFDGNTLAYEWWLPNSTLLGSGTVETPPSGNGVPIPELYLPPGDPRFGVGVHQIELKVSDGVNTPVSAFVSVNVIDTTAPSLSSIPSVTILWPPNHKLQPVTIQANVSDNGGGAIHLTVEVISSEPPDTTGDGETIPDYYIDSVNDETGLIELRLRAERSGKGSGRTYTIVITATDESGNQTTADVDIRAPHDKGTKTGS